MMLPRHSYRTPEFSFAEHRLTHQQIPSAEVDNVATRLQDPKTDLRQLQDAIINGRNEHRKNAAPDAPHFDDEVAEHLKTKKNPEITKNLQTLVERTKADASLGTLRSTIETMKQKVDVPAVQPADPTKAPDANTTPEEKKTFATQIGDTAETISNTILPTTVTEKLSRGQRIAVGAAVTLGAGLLLWQAGKWLFSRSEESAEVGREAASRTSGGFLKKLLIGTGITVAAFFGIRYLFGKKFDDFLKKNLPPLPDMEEIKPYANAAKAGSGTAGGIIDKTTERTLEQAEALKEIPAAAIEYLENGRFDKLAEHGWSFLKKEGKWFFDTGVEAISLPAEAVTKYFSGNLRADFEGGWLYGEAGAAYVLGKATLTFITTGKMRIPLSLRSASMTAGRMAAWPIMMLSDAVRPIQIMSNAEGRMLAKSSITRWGFMGSIQDSVAMRKINVGTVEALEEGMRYFTYQKELLQAMESNIEGPLKGFVRHESIQALKKSNEKLAKEMTSAAAKLKKNLTILKELVPDWVAKLAHADGLTDAKLIVEETDRAGAVLKEAQAAVNTTTNAAKAAGSAPHSSQNPWTTATGKPTTTPTSGGAGVLDDVANAATSTAKTADAVGDTAKGSKVVDTVSENARLLFEQIKNAIQAARKLGDNEQILKLLQSPVIQAAAKLKDKTAQAFLNVWRLVAPGAKWAGRALVVLGPLIDAALIIANRYELADARKSGNKDLVTTLESKQTALIGGAGANLAILALSAPAAAVALPLTIGTTIYTQGVYDAMATWQKSPENWLSYSPKDLRGKIEEYKMGKIDRGHRAAYGYSAAYSMWRWGTSWSKDAKDKNRQEDDKQGENVENVNQHVRQELLAAYFLKTQLPPYEGETPDSYKERVTPLLRDRMIYMNRMTDSTYDASILGERFFEQAGSYADVMTIRRKQQTPALNYTLGDKQRTLDLQSMDYAVNDGLKNNDAAKTKFLQSLYQYEQEIKPQQEAVKDFYRLEASSDMAT